MSYQPDLPAVGATAKEIVTWTLEQFHPHVALACSFSPEDIVLAHLLVQARPDARVFAIDTGRLHEETYQCADTVQRRLGIRIEWYFPQHEEVENLVRTKGLFSFYESLDARHECCRIRKVEPLGRALQGLQAWVTGLRREQNVTRTELAAVARDNAHGDIWKINPLADWTQADVDAYCRKHDLPANRLLRQGFLSIGCAPCTRAVQPGADPRSGRWWWENPEQKECGLHTYKVVIESKEGANI